MKQKAWRHGEIVFLKVTSIPKLAETKSNIFAKGSHGHDHSFKGGKMYLLEKPEGFIIGYFVAKDTKLFHDEHSPKGCELPNGKYQIIKQQEFINKEMVQVID